MTSHKAVFLDRDGVLNLSQTNNGKPFAPRRLEDFKIYPDAADALQALKQDGFLLVVATNQPDVGNGKTARSTVEDMHARLSERLPIDDIRVCYHSQTDGCPCRKPKPGMLTSAAGDLSIDLSASFMIGDRWSDVEAGRAAGCQTIHIERGYAEKQPDSPDFTAASLAEAAAIIRGVTADRT